MFRGSVLTQGIRFLRSVFSGGGVDVRCLDLFEQPIGFFKWFSALVMLPPLPAPAD